MTNEEEKVPPRARGEGVGGPTPYPPSRPVRVSHANNSVRAGAARWKGGWRRGRAAGRVTAIGTGCAADSAPEEEAAAEAGSLLSLQAAAAALSLPRAAGEPLRPNPTREGQPNLE